MKRIKVLQVLNFVGGVEICVRQIIENTDSKQIENIVLSQNIDSRRKITDSKKQKIKHYELTIQRQINVLKDLFAIIKMAEIIRKEKPNLIHAHSAKAGVIARIAALFFDVKILYTPHAFSFLSTNNYLKRKIFIFVERMLKTNKTILLATSKSEKDHAINIVGFNPSKVILLNNAISPIKTQISSSNKIKHKNYICTIGRPSYQKNTAMLIEVFSLVQKKHKNTHLYIIGAGEYSPNLNKINNLIIQKKLSDKITILPWINREEAMAILKNSQLYVSTSRYEGMPYAVIESLCLKTPCVLTNCDGNRDLIIHDETGYLINNMDQPEMSKKICTLLEDKDKQIEFGKNGHRYYQKNHLLSNYIKKLTLHYKAFSN